MKTFTTILCFFTLFLDICLAMGCISSTFFNVGGYAVFGILTSKTPDGMRTIIITVWTALLAICGLLASTQPKSEKRHSIA